MKSTLNTYIRSLGCKVNQVEMEDVSEALAKAGIELNQVDQKAELVVINTCSVTQMSDKKSRQLIRKAAAKNPDAFVIVTGCFATKGSEASDIEGVDLVIANEEKDSLAEVIIKAKGLRASASKEFNISRSRPYIKIADGCDEYCSYCIIPSLRGPLNSQPAEKIRQRVQELADNGAPEIVLTGINIGKYGRDGARHRGYPMSFDENKNAEKSCFSNTLSSLGSLIGSLTEQVHNLPRLRLSSIEINEIDDKIINLIKDGWICRHLHVPLQSGSDKILVSMNRKYKSEYFADKIKKIKAEIPGICISTDVIAGFPGETEDDFLLTKQSLVNAGVDKLHAFKFSCRDGTAAASMAAHVSDNIKSRRVKELNELGALLYDNFLKGQTDKPLDLVLETSAEDENKSLRVGLSDNYIKILVSYTGEARLVKVKTDKVSGKYLTAKLVY